MAVTSILLLSFRHRNAMASALQSEGSDVVAVRRADSVDRQLDQQNFKALIIDARDAVVEALAAAERLGQLRPDYLSRTYVLLAEIDQDFQEAFALCNIAKENIHIIASGAPVNAALFDLAAEKHLEVNISADERPLLNRALRNHIMRGKGMLILCELADLARHNDRHGRAFGDILLQSMIRRIERTLRLERSDSAQIVRFGGARTGIFLPNEVLQGTYDLVAAFDANLSTAYSIHFHAVHPAIRIYAAQARAGDSLDSLMRRAALSKSYKRLQASEARIANAIAFDEINMLYQPQYSAADDRIYGAEALARWQSRDGVEHGAAALVAAALSEQAVPKLGQHIRDRIFADLAYLPKPFKKFPIAINIMPDELHESHFSDELLKAISVKDISPAQVTIEITEHSLLNTQSRALHHLHVLRAVGARIALDDFGTGFSSLAYLKDLPVDILKIDGGFSRDALGSTRERAILGTIIQLARTLDLAVVAEGVESERQLRLLREMGITYYQGFLRSPAVSISDLTSLS